MKLLSALAGLLWVSFAAHAESKIFLSPAEIQSARKVYAAKCAKCHRFYEPKNYSAPEWERWMASMNRKSKLKAAQEQLLVKYLEAYRAGEIPAIPK